jgi:hypothetical protein
MRFSGESRFGDEENTKVEVCLWLRLREKAQRDCFKVEEEEDEELLDDVST